MFVYLYRVTAVFLPQLEDKWTGEMRIFKIAISNCFLLDVALTQTIYVGEI